jgi:hypothetical protein
MLIDPEKVRETVPFHQDSHRDVAHPTHAK